LRTDLLCDLYFSCPTIFRSFALARRPSSFSFIPPPSTTPPEPPLLFSKPVAVTSPPHRLLLAPDTAPHRASLAHCLRVPPSRLFPREVSFASRFAHLPSCFSTGVMAASPQNKLVIDLHPPPIGSCEAVSALLSPVPWCLLPQPPRAFVLLSTPEALPGAFGWPGFSVLLIVPHTQPTLDDTIRTVRPLPVVYPLCSVPCFCRLLPFVQNLPHAYTQIGRPP